MSLTELLLVVIAILLGTANGLLFAIGCLVMALSNELTRDDKRYNLWYILNELLKK